MRRGGWGYWRRWWLSCTEESCWVTVHSVSGGAQRSHPTNSDIINLSTDWGRGGQPSGLRYLLVAVNICGQIPPQDCCFLLSPCYPVQSSEVISVSFEIIQVWLCCGGGHHHNYPDTHHLYLRTSDIYLHFLAGLENCCNPVSQP